MGGLKRLLVMNKKRNENTLSQKSIVNKFCVYFYWKEHFLSEKIRWLVCMVIIWKQLSPFLVLWLPLLPLPISVITSGTDSALTHWNRFHYTQSLQVILNKRRGFQWQRLVLFLRVGAARYDVVFINITPAYIT